MAYKVQNQTRIDPRARIFQILELTESNSPVSRAFNLGITILILVSVVCFILETVDNISVEYKQLFEHLEILAVIVFSVEYILRVWSCTSHQNYRHPLWGRLRYMMTPMVVIDLVSILPFYLPMFLPNLAFAREIRVYRLFRLLKMGRHSKAMQTLGNVIKAKGADLAVTLFSVLIILIFTASLMFMFEHEAQPSVFNSIPMSMWWSVITLTSVGYGDIYPITPLGRLLASMVAVMGMGLFALPAGIIASGFAEEHQIQLINEKKILCPHCGEEIHKASYEHPHSK